MTFDTPIVFLHQGSAWYLPYVINQARRASPDSSIYLIGDYGDIPGITVVAAEDLLSDDISEFVDAYEHMSGNEREFELICWLRWFYARNLLRSTGRPDLLHLDSDVLLYSSVEEICRWYESSGSWTCAFLMPMQDPDSFIWAVSGHVGYWTRGALEAFCRFALESFRRPDLLQRYRDKWHWHLETGSPGGVCDMTTLYQFVQENPEVMHNLVEPHNGAVFDDNVNSGANWVPNQYQKRNGIKRIEFSNGRPYFVPVDDRSSRHRCHTLHFSGRAKIRMKGYYTGGPFRGQIQADLGYLRALVTAKIRAWRRKLRRFTAGRRSDAGDL